MVESVKVLPKEIQDMIEVHVWNVKELAGINRKKALGARCIPSIALNGDVIFESGIPPEEELAEAILKRYAV